MGGDALCHLHNVTKSESRRFHMLYRASLSSRSPSSMLKEIARLTATDADEPETPEVSQADRRLDFIDLSEGGDSTTGTLIDLIEYEEDYHVGDSNDQTELYQLDEEILKKLGVGPGSEHLCYNWVTTSRRTTGHNILDTGATISCQGTTVGLSNMTRVSYQIANPSPFARKRISNTC
jgi:hypothetical protein